MIAMLIGEVVEIDAPLVTLNVQGVGYELICSKRRIESLTVKESISMVVYTEVREDSIRLYGFLDRLEKQVFLLLLKVKGVGAKSACDIVSQVDKVELLRMIGAEDLTRLQTVKGIGKKTAERIVVELREKVGEFAIERALTPVGSGLNSRSIYADAVEALQALGFSRRIAESAVAQVQAKQVTGESIQNSDSLAASLRDSGDVVRAALRFI